tara:strand:- start:251 stop:1027 length:777 start_codon:yes stop_codon:yes gene_type:complete
LKYLYANGCSFTWGGGFEETFIGEPVTDIFDSIDSGLRLGIGNKSGWLESSQPSSKKFENWRCDNTWPKHTASELDLKIIKDDSLGGSSNARILRTTIDSFKGFIKSGIEHDILALIQLTDSTRFDLYSSYSQERILGKVDVWDWGPNKNPKEKDALKKFFECFVDLESCDEHLIEQIILLQSFFKLYDIKYKFIWGWSYPQNTDMFDLVDFNNFIFDGNQSMINFMWDNYNQDCYESRHLRPSGHEIWGKTLSGELL